jgi:hypothetical protein
VSDPAAAGGCRDTKWKHLTSNFLTLPSDFLLARGQRVLLLPFLIFNSKRTSDLCLAPIL